MRVICASCRVEGRSGDLGEKAPFDDPTETHGYCARHAAQLLASLPSLSFPDAEMLLVVRRPDPTLFEYLQRRLVGVRGVQVILERRQGDRRREARPPPFAAAVAARPDVGAGLHERALSGHSLGGTLIHASAARRGGRIIQFPHGPSQGGAVANHHLCAGRETLCASQPTSAACSSSRWKRPT